MIPRLRSFLFTVLAVLLCLFTLAEVNYPRLQPQSALAIFTMLGLMLCFLQFPTVRHSEEHPRPAWLLGMGYLVDLVLIVATAFACGYVVVQSEPLFEPMWSEGLSLGNRAGIETNLDFLVGILGLIVVIESTRRSIGIVVPLLAAAFILHSYYNYASFQHGWPLLPDWMLPHAGQNWKDLACTTFLQSSGVFGQAANVMFRYVFLFVIFGAFLELSGATQFIIDFARRAFGNSSGGPAKVSVLSSALMGSLSGSAVANAVTTGAFTIPLMKSSGFKSHEAAAVEAAAGSGGALVPPVMGAAAYMMLELVEGITLLQIIRAALLPAILYYLSLFLIVHFHAAKIGGSRKSQTPAPPSELKFYDGVTFFGSLLSLIGLLFFVSPFKAVTGAIIVVLALNLLQPRDKVSPLARAVSLTTFLVTSAAYQYYLFQFTDYFEVVSLDKVVTSFVDAGTVGMFVGILLTGFLHAGWRTEYIAAMRKAARNGVPLIAAAACVGIIIGVVEQTGISNDVSRAIKNVVESSLFLALFGIMCCSLVLGMGVPSVVCYLLLATMMGPLLVELGAELSVTPLAAHLFIFYFGMMSMVTPPVALAAYAAASIAEAPVMRTSFTAFRFSLAGFTLPYMFVYRPALLLTSPVGMPLYWYNVALAIVMSSLGILALSAGIVGYYRTRMTWGLRLLAFLSAALLLSPHLGGRTIGLFVNLAGVAVLAVVTLMNTERKTLEAPQATLEA